MSGSDEKSGGFRVLQQTGAELDGAIQRQEDAELAAVAALRSLPADRAVGALLGWENQSYRSGYKTGKMHGAASVQADHSASLRIGAHNCSCYLRNSLKETFETIKSDMAEIHRAQVRQEQSDAPPDQYLAKIVRNYLPAVVAGIEKIKAEIESGIGDPQEL